MAVLKTSLTTSTIPNIPAPPIPLPPTTNISPYDILPTIWYLLRTHPAYYHIRTSDPISTSPYYVLATYLLPKMYRLPAYYLLNTSSRVFTTYLPTSPSTYYHQPLATTNYLATGSSPTAYLHTVPATKY